MSMAAAASASSVRSKGTARPKLSFGQAVQAVVAQPKVEFSLPKKRQREAEREAKKAREARRVQEEKRLVLEKDHVQPSTTRTAHDQMLLKTATRGVVKLFNAIVKQQKAAPQLEKRARYKKQTKVEEMSKQQFLDLLKGESGHKE